MSFKVGDLVECVDARLRDGSCAHGDLILGAIYTVHRIYVDARDTITPNSLTACLRELQNWDADGGDRGFLARRFRLIHTPKADFIEALKSLPADLVGAE